MHLVAVDAARMPSVLTSPSAPTMVTAREWEDRGDIEAAATLVEAILEHRHTTYGDSHPRTQHAKRKLASLWHDSGRVAAAVRLYRAILCERNAVLGECHPRTLTASVDLAMALAEVGHLEEAEELLRVALYGQASAKG